MAENDTHYNEISDSGDGQTPQTAAGGGQSNKDHGLTTPLPEFEQGPPAYPGYTEGENTFPSFPNWPGTGGGGGNGNSGWFPVFPGFPVFPSLPSQSYGQVRFLNASTNSFPVNISIDGKSYAAGSRFGAISDYDWISDGFHTVTVRRAGGLRSVLLQQNFPFSAGKKTTMVLTDAASGGLEMIQVSDSGCSNLPAGSGCYRFANMSYSGSSVSVMLAGNGTVFGNVGFQTVTAYKQAMAGTYQFYLTGSGSYSVVRELPILVIGVGGSISAGSQSLLAYRASISAGTNTTSYLIGNTWSDNSLRVLTVDD